MFYKAVQFSITIWWGKNVVMWLSVANTYCQLCQTKQHTFRNNMNGKGFQRKLGLASERITQRLQSSVWILKELTSQLLLKEQQTIRTIHTHLLLHSGTEQKGELLCHCCPVTVVWLQNYVHVLFIVSLIIKTTHTNPKQCSVNSIHYTINIFRIPKIIG